MALRDLSFIKYLEAAFRHKLFKDPNATYFNYLGFNLFYKSAGGKKGVFEYARKVLPFAYTNEFADSDEGNLRMARAVIERLDREGKSLDLFIQSQIPQDYDLILDGARVQSEQAQAVPAQPASGGELPATMLGGIPSVGVQGRMRTIRVPQTKPPTETPLEKRVPGLKTTPETGLDYEGKPIQIPSALKSAGKSLASDTQIGIKKGLTRAGGGFRNILGGIGRGAGGILSGIGSGGVRFLGGAGSTLSNMGTQMTRSRGLAIRGRVLLIFLLPFLLVGFFALTGFAPAQAPGQQPVTQLPPVTGGTCPDQATIDANKKDPNTCRYFNLGVNIFDTNISQTAIDTYINNYGSIFVNGGLGDLNEFRNRVNLIISKSQLVGLNPVIYLGYWKTESLFGTNTSAAIFGCAPGQGVKSFEAELNCAIGLSPNGAARGGSVVSQCASPNNPQRNQACTQLKAIRGGRPEIYGSIPINYPISTFDDFAEAYGSRAPNLNQDGSINNNCTSTYNKLVEVAKELNACKVSTPPVTAVASCPVPNGRITYASYDADPRSGHCTPGSAEYPCQEACPFSGRRAKSIDVDTTTVGREVRLPTISNQTVDWKFIQVLCAGSGQYPNCSSFRGGTGGLQVFEGTVSGSTDKWALQFVHMEIPHSLELNKSYPSRTLVGRTDIGVVHISIGKDIGNPLGSGSATTDCDLGWIAADFMCKP